MQQNNKQTAPLKGNKCSLNSQIILKRKGQEIQMRNKNELLFTTDLPFDIDKTGINAFVGSSLGFTINLGNMEFVRCDTHVSLPCYPDKENMDKATKLAQELVSKESIEHLEFIKSNSEAIRKGLHESLKGSELVNE